MKLENVFAAAELIAKHWQSGAVMAALPDTLRPMTAAEGYQIQTQLSEIMEDPVVGYKIAATAAAGQQHIGVRGPIAGRLLRLHVHHASADSVVDVTLGANRMRMAECEFAFVLAHDLPSTDEPLTRQQVMDAVASLHPALEFPDSRFAKFETVGEACLAADNACAHEIVVGEAATANWRTMDLSKHVTHLYKNDHLATKGSGADVLDDPRDALTWLANNQAHHGIALRAGDIVTTGVCGKPTPIAHGDVFVADLGTLGRVAARLV